MKSLLLASVTAAAVSAVSLADVANAADARIPVKAPMVSPAPAPITTSNWSGCYGGLHLGGGWAHTSWTDTVAAGGIDATLAGRTAKTDMSGAMYGGQVGCDFSFGGPLVLGIDGSLSGSRINGIDADDLNTAWTLHSKHDWLGAVTGRVGFAFDRALIYARGGIAWANTQFEITNSNVLAGNPSTRRQGWVVGAGVEWAFSQSWSLFVEGDYYQFGHSNVSFAGDFINPTPAFTVNTKETVETIKVGVNYRFGNIFGY